MTRRVGQSINRLWKAPPLLGGRVYMGLNHNLKGGLGSRLWSGRKVEYIVQLLRDQPLRLETRDE